MYLFFTLTAGILISLIALLNGTLTAAAGLYLTTVIIHVTAIIFALIILWIGKNSFIPKKKLPLWMYCGGLISVMCTLCSNYAFGKINLIAITALGLLAQAIASLIIDCFGLLGARKRRVRPATWVCIAFSSCGIVYMLYGSEMSVFSAIAASFAAGIGLVVSRVISASLAEYSGTVGSSLINHMIGLPLAVLLLFVVGSSELAALPGSLTGAPAWSYLGGVVGMLIIVITNVVLSRISAFQVSLLLFVGQVFSSAAIDILMGVDFSGRVFYGGVLIAAGILVNTILEKKFSNGTAELEHGSTTDKELISDFVGNSASAETKE